MSFSCCCNSNVKKIVEPSEELNKENNTEPLLVETNIQNEIKIVKGIVETITEQNIEHVKEQNIEHVKEQNIEHIKEQNIEHIKEQNIEHVEEIIKDINDIDVKLN